MTRVIGMNRMGSKSLPDLRKPKKMDAAQLAAEWQKERAAQARRFKPRSSTKITNEVRQAAMDTFFAIDSDSSGTIDAAELIVMLKSRGQNPTEAEVEQIMLQADENGDGKIGLREFLDFYADLLSPSSAYEMETHHMRELLAACGDDKGESITKKTIKNILHDHYDLDVDIDSILSAAFKKGVGAIEEAQSIMDDTLTMSELSRVFLERSPSA